jgi:hypothetical protein
MSEIILELTLIEKLILVVLLSLAAFLVVLKNSSINTSIAVFQDPFSMPFSICKIPVEMVLIGPVVVSSSIGQILFEHASVNLAIIES